VVKLLFCCPSGGCHALVVVLFVMTVSCPGVWVDYRVVLQPEKMLMVCAFPLIK
jgi:hypothetical protein